MAKTTDDKPGQAKKPRATAKAKPATATKKPATRAKTPKPAATKAAPAADPVPAPVELSPEDELIASMDVRHVQFVEHYLIDLNGTKAYKAAFDSDMRDHVARSAASRLLTSVNVRKLMALRIKAMFDRTEGLQDRMLAQQFALAFADPNELVEHRRESCRYCHGAGHKYQFKPSEWAERELEWQKEVREALAAEKEPPELDEQGGVGFDPRREPHPDCPECFGEGSPRIVMKDTRSLSPAAKALYAGAKWGKDGMEILTHSQEKAREVLLKILKLYDDKAEVILGVVPAEKLDELYAQAMEQAAKGRERTMGRKPESCQEGA